MGKTGRPLADPARGRMTPRLVHVDDPTWDAVKAAADAEGVPLAEIVRRALRESVGSTVGDA